MQHLIENRPLLDGIFGGVANRLQQTLPPVDLLIVKHVEFKCAVNKRSCLIVLKTAIGVEAPSLVAQRPRKFLPRPNDTRQHLILRLKIVCHVERAPVHVVSRIDRHQKAHDYLEEQLFWWFVLLGGVEILNGFCVAWYTRKKWFFSLAAIWLCKIRLKSRTTVPMG